MIKYILALVILSITLITSCNQQKKEEVQTPDANRQMDDPHTGVMPGHGDLNTLTEDSNQDFSDPIVKISGVELTTPDSWQREAPASSLRVLQYSLKSDPNLKVTGFFFGEQDLIKENIDRWKAEFTKLDKTNETKLVSDKIIFVVLEGTYKLKPFPMAQEFTPTDNYMVLAAIVPSPEGPYYFKIYGPKDKLNNEINSFKKFLNSYKMSA